MSVLNLLIHSFDTPQNQRLGKRVNSAILIPPISHAHRSHFMSREELPTVHKHGLQTNQKRNISGETSASSQSRRSVSRYGSTHSIFGMNTENIQRESLLSSNFPGRPYSWYPDITTRYLKEVIQKLCNN